MVTSHDKPTLTYQDAGVDIHKANQAVQHIKKAVRSTFSPHVIGDLGGFGACFDLKAALADYTHPVMVQSIDGVGTKAMVATMADNYHHLGADLLSACSNDIVVMGAKPLTLLDYIASSALNTTQIEQFIDGLAQACKANQTSLVGGEMAEMPGTYLPDEYDFVGIVTGVVEKSAIIDGHNIKVGQGVYALSSSGLHTNGFSLARKLIFDVAQWDIQHTIDACQQTVAEVLLTPHINYTMPVLTALAHHIPILGMAHITGGGVLENIPRVLPSDCAVRLHKSHFPKLPIFDVLVELGNLPDHEAYKTFNMGAGLVLIGSDDLNTQWRKLFQSDWPLQQIGEVIAYDAKTQQQVTLV